MGTEQRKSTTACLAAAFILTCHLVQMSECLRLTKTERRAARKGFNVDVQEGKILFGDVFEKQSPPVTDGNWKTSSNASVEDETSYQADFAGWTQPEMDDALKEEWNRRAAFLRCFRDHLMFRLLGPSASQLEVEQENEELMPLAMVPPKCGYKMHENSKAFVMMVPYNGCNMKQQDDDFKLLLRWRGNPFSLLCPKRGKKSYHHWPQAPQMSQYPQVPQIPQEPRYPQAPQIPQEPRYPQAPQEPRYPQAPQIPQEPRYPQAPQIPQEPRYPQAPQIPRYPQVPRAPQAPQIPQVPRAPQDVELQYLSSLYSHPLFSYLFTSGAEESNLPQYSFSSPRQAFSVLTPVTSEDPGYPPMPLDPYFWPFGSYSHDLPSYFPFLPEYQNILMPLYPKNPVTEYPRNPTPEMKTTAAPTTSETPMPSAVTQAPTDIPQSYSPENLPFLPYGQELPHFFYPYQG
ncbi:uncharacterized protein LOC119415088 isoform X2 [Nematolebias whitei]|uniref:uncharacterized protein LOC119415088 isoform X2 n=1 Tax=Nematolebias whitei TaxID=451745 RepID=UPI0018983610|nr:uncharacterized protein LOC119415088 isoform X2 [Nematolebias whitei]